jgi:two-component system, chemotaxis family, CheB/CheR fusion protein
MAGAAVPEAQTNPEAAGNEQSSQKPFPIIGVGASAGGLEAFNQLLSNLPDNSGMAFVLVQHLDPKHESRLGDILSRAARMPVLEAKNGMPISPNHVYVIPPNSVMTMTDNVLLLAPRPNIRGPHLPVDHFFKSLAEDRKTSAIGVVLSGTGSDGTLGLEEIKAAGGITFAQEEHSAKYAGMPQSAVRSGCVDVVLPPEGIAHELIRIGQHPYIFPRPAAEYEASVNEEEEFKRVLNLLRVSFGVDFAGYRDTTIRRRIMRRMVLHTKENLAEYSQVLEQNRAELEALYEDILINVTSFFREAEAFDALKTSVFPQIVQGRSPSTPIRVWAPGCSTGQEAYSLAIALLEFLDDKGLRAPVQLFATDLSDTVSLQRAREGIYPDSIEAEVSPERLRRFFTKEDSKYRINKALRDICVFAKQNVASDPPFSRIDLISCRNLLIYLSPNLQKRVIPTFHYALNPKGFLLLGASETIGSFTDLFSVVDHKHRIYLKKASAIRPYPYFGGDGFHASASAEPRHPATPTIAPLDWQREADRLILSRYAPPGVFVNDNLEILHFRGQTGPYLAPAPGEASLNVLKMAREGLLLDLRNALSDCRQKNEEVRREKVRVRSEGQVHEITLRVMPVRLPSTSDHCFVILFEEEGAFPRPATIAGHTGGVSSEPRPRLLGLLGWLLKPWQSETSTTAGLTKSALERESDQLRQELSSTREYLQSVIEQQDAAKEELKSANEEILSSNEELQSTNEELETAKEELQSINEELTTINEQLNNRNAELSRLNDDFTNLFSSANIPMLTLGVDLRIRRFTPAAGKLLNLLPGDIGRPIGNLKPPVEVPDLEALVAEVIDTIKMMEREVRDAEGRWYMLRVYPYRTADNKIDGAVVVLLDIDQVKVQQARLSRQSSLIDLSLDAIITSNSKGEITSWNRGAQLIYGWSEEEVKGKTLDSILKTVYPPDFPDLNAELTQKGHWEGDLIHTRRSGTSIGVESRQIVIRDERGSITAFLEINRDTTERQRTEQARAMLAAIVESSGDAIISKDLANVITSWNAGAENLFGYTMAEAVGQSIELIVPPDRLGEEKQILEQLRRNEKMEPFDTVRARKDGSLVHVSVTSSPIRDSSGRIIGVSKLARDITSRIQIEQALNQANQNKDHFLAMLAHELRNPLAPLRNGLQILRLTGGHSPQIDQARDMMDRQVQHLTRLIDDLLDVSRIAHGRIELRKEHFDLAELVKETVDACQPFFEPAHHLVSVIVPPEPLFIEADPVRVAQIIENLLTNAAKYTDRGGRIEVRAEKNGDEACIRVRDSGIGLTPEMLPRIWDMFTQADKLASRSRSGLGLGLTLVRSLAELHGGHVTAHSEGVNQGSEFGVCLPLLLQKTEAPEKEKGHGNSSPGKLTGRRIMVVDDNTDSAQSLGLLLQLMGNDVKITVDPEKALESALTHSPEIILLDLEMPKQNGFEVARQLRRNGGLDKAVIIAVSGYGTAEDRRRCLEAGFDAHLIKPLSMEALQEVLETEGSTRDRARA